MENIVNCVAAEWQKDFRIFMNTPHPISGHPIYFGNVVDKMTDNGNVKCQLHMACAAYQGKNIDKKDLPI